uniref:Retrotransposon gag domain-containing protein n=1 Tax=Hyaloperonospora arabidopsidis (strain Emoy2) TaxID=559515 RepID=M4BLJ7_HYAAE
MEKKADLRGRREGIEIAPRSTPKRAKEDAGSTTQGQLQSYFDASMEQFQQEHRNQARHAIYPIQRIKIARDFESYTPDIEMGSVGSHHGGAEMQYRGAGDPDNSGQAKSRRPLVATTETVPDGGLSAPQIRMSAIAELKEFNRKDKDEDRARSWIGKVKSVFLRDQARDVEECLIFGDLLKGPAINWHSQLSQSTRHSWEDLLESFSCNMVVMVCQLGDNITLPKSERKRHLWITCIV